MYKTRILVNGKAIPKYHDREGNIWVEARYGTRYSIEVKNDTWKRALAIISVDGLNIVNGKRKKPNLSTGYVISPFNNVIIKGWRISSEQIKEFYFTSPQDSYSNKLGADKKNIGVIGCFIYEEVPKQNFCNYSSASMDLFGDPIPRDYLDYNYTPTYTAANTDNVSSCSYQDGTPRLSKKMATGSGNKINDGSHKVHFGKKVLAASMTIYYDNKENLVNRGVIRENYSEELPKPFPSGEYCPDV